MEQMDWGIELTDRYIVAAVAFRDFDQSQRFLEVVVKFLKDEHAEIPLDPDVGN
jgi:hypothetical protein